MSEIFLNIEPQFKGKYALWHTGFRPFFILAALFGFVLMLLWGGIFFHGKPPLGQMYFLIGGISWHAHEMIFGFGGAVVVGFLLTAVKNWTNIPTFSGKPLALLAFLWLIGRILPFVQAEGTLFIWLSAFLECAFWFIIAQRLTHNILLKKQYKQFAIIGKVWLFVPAALVFHLGLLNVWHLGVIVGLYSGFYLLLALILTMARRVMPMFIERGLNNGFVPENSIAVDKWSLVLFLIFSIVEIIAQVNYNSILGIASGTLAALQALLHFYRLSLWHHKALWRHPLLMSVFLGYVFFILGFVMVALYNLFGIGSVSLATHTFAIGALALFAFGMMARIALGHTARNVYAPPRFLSLVFYALFAAVIFRVFLVLLFPEQTFTWIFIAQLFWLAACALFVLLYLPMLILAKKDGTFG